MLILLMHVVAWVNIWTLTQAVTSPAREDGCTALDDMGLASTGKSLLQQAPATKSVASPLANKQVHAAKLAVPVAHGQPEAAHARISNSDGPSAIHRSFNKGVPAQKLAAVPVAPRAPIAENSTKRTPARAPRAHKFVAKSQPKTIAASAVAEAVAEEVLNNWPPVVPVSTNPSTEVSAGAPAKALFPGEYLIAENPPKAETPTESETLTREVHEDQADAPAEQSLMIGQNNEFADAVTGNEDVSAMLQDLFGSPDRLKAAADYWLQSGLHDTMVENVTAAPEEQSQTPSALWVRLTKALVKGGELPMPLSFSGKERTSTSAARASLNLWNSKVADKLRAQGVSGMKCAETGDGHFLNADFTDLCAEILSVDLYDASSDVKVDLNLPPDQAPMDIQIVKGTFDVLVSHQVFEHLQHPVAGMANLNAMVKPGGTLLFTTPFLVQDHHDPYDYFRYTLRNVHELLVCGGFEVIVLEGLGGYIGSISYMAGVPAEDMDPEDLNEVCDGLSESDEFCKDRYYTLAAALGLKTREVPYEEIRDCFG